MIVLTLFLQQLEPGSHVVCHKNDSVHFGVVLYGEGATLCSYGMPAGMDYTRVDVPGIEQPSDVNTTNGMSNI